MTALIHRNGGTWNQRGIPRTLLFEVKRHYIVIKPKCLFSGPDFLWKHNRHWPEMPRNMFSVAHDDPEIKRNVYTVVAKEAKCFLRDMTTYFSSWTKLLNVIAWWLRFKTFCKVKLKQKAGYQPEFPRKNFISCEEINQASTEVVKPVEKEAYKDIRRKLKNYEVFPNNQVWFQSRKDFTKLSA